MPWPLIIGFVAGGGYLLWRDRRQLAQKRAFDAGVQNLHVQVRSRLGVSPTVEFMFTEQTAAAATDGQTVFVNRGWLLGMLAPYSDDLECQRAIVVGVIGHELGHVMRPSSGYHPTDWTSNHVKELLADQTAGVALAQADVDPACFGKVLDVIAQAWSHTHPESHQRKASLCKGYRHAGGYEACPWGHA